MKRSHVVLLLALLILACVGTGRAQQQNLLTFGITGSGGSDYNAAMDHLAVQKLLLEIAAEPRPPEFLDAALQGTDVTRNQLERLELVRRQGDRYVISFTLLTSADVRRVREMSEQYARTLAAEFLARRPEIESAAARSAAKGAEPKGIAYIVLGCFSLDWDGLDITAQKGYRTTASPRPNGERYIPWAEQKSEISLQGIYWGSHSDDLTDVAFTSFGDHFSLPRYALPDLFWRLPGRATQGNLPDALKPKVAGALRVALRDVLQQAGQMMFALRDGEKTLDELARASGLPSEQAADLLAFLVELDYVQEQGGHYAAGVPVLTERDLAMTSELRRIGREIMERWLAAHYEGMKTDLAGLTPLRYGVSFADGFTQIWHYIFGTTNRHLVEAGLFADPYAEGRKYKGFIPIVWHPSLTVAPR